MREIIAVGGRPGTGKTTLFREFMKDYTWEVVEPIKLLPCMYSKDLDLYVIGKYEEGEVFAGTDRLSMAVQPAAEKFFSDTKSNILYEGDRIFNQSFLEFCSELPEVSLNILYLKTSEEILSQRYLDRGSNQSEVFLKGRETKYNNILTNFSLMTYISTYENSSLEQQAIILAFLRKTLTS